MLKKLLLAIIVLLPLLVLSQDFPGNNPEILIGTKVKPIDVSQERQEYKYENFYKSFNFKSDNRIFPVKRGSYSNYDSLVNRIFDVKEVYDKMGVTYLLLNNEDIGDVYYNYSKYYEHSFELKIVDYSSLKKDIFCNSNHISKVESKVDNSTTYYARVSGYENTITKVKENGKIYYFLSLSKNSTGYATPSNGLTILFEDNTRLKFPNEEVSASVTSSGYNYHVFHRLTVNEIKILKSKRITDYKLSFLENSLSQLDGIKLMYLMECLENYNN